ncbi:MAG: hypothetical protein IMZ53_05885 [Thermoplasmata archaeon]|nr:hypothetical protein [Thermoplasmata archaeon]
MKTENTNRHADGVQDSEHAPRFNIEWTETTEENNGNPTFDAYIGRWKLGTVYRDVDEVNDSDMHTWKAYSRFFMDTTGTKICGYEEAEKWLEDMINDFLNDIAKELMGQLALCIAENERLCQQLAEK